MKINFTLFDKTLSIRCFGKPKLAIKGYTSRCEDGQHVLFLDYDMVSPEIVALDMATLKPYITHAYVFTTKEETTELGVVGNYHIICIDKFLYHEIFDLMKLTHCDSLHTNLAKRTRYRAWVLRFTGKGGRSKPQFKHFYKNQTMNNRQQSLGHYDMIHILNPEIDKSDSDLMELDGSTKVVITEYNTMKQSKW